MSPGLFFLQLHDIWRKGDRITQAYDHLAAEQVRFKAIAIALNNKLDRKVRTADVLFNWEQQFDKAVYRRFRNRLNVLFELAECWMVWVGLAAITLWRYDKKS